MSQEEQKDVAVGAVIAIMLIGGSIYILIRIAEFLLHI